MMRLSVRNGQLTAVFPQERPIDGADVDVWDCEGNFIGSGCSQYTRESGIIISVDDSLIDSNSMVYWLYSQQ